MSERVLRIVAEGRVQGVYYRAFTRQVARELGLRGWVRNCADGTVEIVAAGPEPAMERFKARLREGPPASRVDALQESVLDEAPPIAHFEVRQ